MTTIAIHQPQYLPWPPYFQKIASADVFVYLDNVQYQKRGLQNRNQIKGPDGPQWLTVPVNARRDHRIADVRIADQQWQARHARSIGQYYARAPHLWLYSRLIEPALEARHDLLIDLNLDLMRRFLDFLEIDTRIVKASALDAVGTKEDLIIEICKELKGTRYLSGSGARDYQSDARFAEQGLVLEYHLPRVQDYSQCHMKDGFVQGMSLVDAILNLGDEAKTLL